MPPTSQPSNARGKVVVVVFVLAVLAVIVFFVISRCQPQTPAPARTKPPVPTQAPGANTLEVPQLPAPPTTAPATQPDEILTPATLTVPPTVMAGAAFEVAWVGPDNDRDFITIVAIDSPTETIGHYQETEQGAILSLTAPIEPGAYEVRYVTGRSRTILGRVPVEVTAITATVEVLGGAGGAKEVMLGSTFEVRWTGPNNEGDYITVVAKDAPDEAFASYVDTEKGGAATVVLTAPPTAGEVEVRYVSGQGRKVLARQSIMVVMPQVTMTAPESAVAGTTIEVMWTGPNNQGDYITVVAKAIPDGQYGAYTNTATGNPLKLLLPIMEGEAELRYMTGQGNKVLARRALMINAATITMSAVAEAKADTDVSVTWTGPNNPGDYITIVPKSKPDGQWGVYTNTSGGSPLMVKSPKEVGEAEIRYMTGQGNKVLARVAIRIVE